MSDDYNPCPCGDEVAPGRWALGIRVCLECGEASAQAEKAYKARSVVVMHKSNPVYIGRGQAGKDFVKDVAAMRKGVDG